jgi:hypothetical protein
MCQAETILLARTGEQKDNPPPAAIKERKKMDTEKTIVIFRKFRSGDKAVIALFPEEPGSNDARTMMSYMHIGQHGGAVGALANNTDAASESEYRDLAKELAGIGYNMDIRRRITRRMDKARLKKLGYYKEA